MRNFLNVIEKNRNINKRIIAVFICLSILVEAVIVNLLIRPAYSLVNKADCGIIEHTHISECYSECKQFGTSVLVCCSGLSSEKLSHVHDDFCYDEDGKIICPIPEYQHIHTEECYDENGVQICGISYHQHREECFRVLGEKDSALILECGMKSHIHEENCYLMISSVSSDEVNEDSVETYEPEPEMYKPEIVNEISYAVAQQSIDIDASQGFELKQENIKSIVLQYTDEKGKWNIVTSGMVNVPASKDTEVMIEIAYSVNKSDIVSHNNQIVYTGLPEWLNPNQTANIPDKNGVTVATLVAGNGNAVITFTQSYIDRFVSTAHIDGDFKVGGYVDWKPIDDPSNPDKVPFLDLNFQFEDDLSAKYGQFEVEKSSDNELIEVRGSDGKITHTYVRYELKVKSLESNREIPEICITDTLSTENNRPNINNVIKGSGYVGVSGTATTLTNGENNYNPYETISGVADYTGGTVVLDNNSMKWNIANLKANEERILVYYVELNEKYIGSGSAGTLRNEVQPESKGFKKEIVRDEFIPKADVDITKTQGNINVNALGNGTVDYTVVVTASDDNSYTITDACIKDSFRDGMANYVDKTNGIAVTIKSGNTQQTQNISVGTDGFNIPISELKRGEKVEVTYSVPVKNIFASNNGDVSFSNHASFVGDETGGKLQNGYTFKGNGVTTTISHNQWSRKLNGERVETAKNIDFSGNTVYNYGGGTVSNGSNSFTVPQNAQEYIIIVNEDGLWNMSNTNFSDRFDDTRIAYRGYIKIEEFAQTSEIPENNTLSNNDVLSILNKNTPTKTIWIDIDGRHNFDVVPTKYGLTDGNKVYRLTYYASVDPSQTNIKNIVIANSFMITGTIGIEGDTIYLNGVRTVVSTTLTGSASYDFEKESLFYENKHYTSGNGEIYWVIRANGTLPKNLHIQDQPSNNSMRSDSLIGVYYGDKGYDFSEITSYEELENVLSGMEEIEGGTSRYFYNLESISSLDALDGKDYAIFSHGTNRSGYLTGIKNGDKIQGESLSNRINFGDSVTTTSEVQMWHFERVSGETDKFYVYYTDSSGTHYMHIGNDTATTSNTPAPLTVSIDNNNQIKIANPDDTSRYEGGEALNWNGDNGVSINYAGWKNFTNDSNNWHYIGTPDNTTKYDYKPQTITDISELDGKQFAIITPGDNYSGLLTGEKSGSDALTAQLYNPHFKDSPPDDIIISTRLKKWTFQKITGEDDKFYVYYVDANNQRQYLTLGNTSATTTTTPYAIQISCDNGRIKLKDTQHSGHTLNWHGGDNPNDLRYRTWNDQNSYNDLHYVVTEEIVSQDSSSGNIYNWAYSSNHGSIKIINNTVVPQDKSMYIVMRTQPNQDLSGYFSKIFNNAVGIMDDSSGHFDVLDKAEYIYNPDLPVRKEGMVAAYYDGKTWTNRSVSPSGDRATKVPDSDIFNLNHLFNGNFDPTGYVASQGEGLYVEWLVNVNWDGTLEGDVILTDYLNHKMTPILVREFNTSGGTKPNYFDLPELENNSKWEKITVQTNTNGHPDVPFYYNKTTGELKVGVGNLHKSDVSNGAVVNLQLICRVTDPDILFSGDIATLTNTAEVSNTNGTLIGSHTQNHGIRPSYSISKVGKGVGDDNNNHHTTNKMEYTIEINPFAEDLVYDGDILPVLIDEMSNNMELMGTVEVYQKTGDTETKLDNIKYSVTAIDDKTQIKFENLPDKKHLIIKYKTKVNVKPNQKADISNIAYWEGYKQPSEPQCSEEFRYNLSGSVSSRETPVIEINKLDFYDNGITLGGAKFEIRKVDTDGTIDNSDVITATTSNDGKIRFAEGESNELSCNIVYQIKEVKAPTDYVLNNTPKYFMVINPNDENSYNITDDDKMNIGEEQTDVIITYISDNEPDLEVTFYNKKASVMINKVFLDESGKPSNSFYGTYHFGLYDRNPITSNKKPVQILSITYSENGISYALDGKETSEPKFTKARAGDINYIYELDEQNQPIVNGKTTSLNRYSFDVEYDSDNSVFVNENGATVTVTNKHHPIYLPMTGGIGLHKYYSNAFCVLMVLLSLAIITLKVQKKYK